MNKQIADLAKSMNVTVADVLCLARSIINSMEKDKVTETFIQADNEDQAELVRAYAVDANKKMESFVAQYFITKAKHGQDAFRSTVRALL